MALRLAWFKLLWLVQWMCLSISWMFFGIRLRDAYSHRNLSICATISGHVDGSVSIFFCHFWSNAILPIWSLAKCHPCDNNLYNDFDKRYVIWLKSNDDGCIGSNWAPVVFSWNLVLYFKWVIAPCTCRAISYLRAVVNLYALGVFHLFFYTRPFVFILMYCCF